MKTGQDEFAMLRVALVGPRHQRLYESSASFHAAIDSLARMLPAWVEGLASQIEPYEEQMAENVRRSMFGQPMESVSLPDILRTSGD